MEVRPGYKLTEVGVIPDDWVVAAISQVAPLQRGFDLPARSIKPGPFPIVYSNGSEGFHNVAMVKGPGVATGRSGTLGKLHYIDSDYWPHNTSLWVTRFNENDPKFIYYLYHSLHFERFASGSGVPTLNRNDAHGHQIAVPRDRAEQRAIATALSDVDALLAGLERLIAKKRDLKQAAMQQLLTGQTRLPGFQGEWAMKRLGDVVETDPENLVADTRADFFFNYIALEDVDRGFLRSYTEQVFASAPSRARRKLKANDVLVSTVRPNLKSHLLFSRQMANWICSTGFCVLRCREGVTNPTFIFSQLFAGEVNRQIDALLTGSNYPAINSGDVRALTIAFPEFDEQTAIATVLTDMATELTALEARRDKTRSLKQGMMQELLTGRTRLV
ncbi:MAG: restriction endonuclease subunit S [Serpentinimonas sp.]|nr:restriction endonuclease subunit S [Serpentinimonas sp.]